MKTQCKRYLPSLLGWCTAALLLTSASVAFAKDVRFALLVGHQVGWKKDPRLNYAITGDLRPLAHTLKRLGFEVKTLENQGPNALRQTLQWLRQRVARPPRMTTFLFYYSGHSDRQFLHMGPRHESNPMSYQELVGAFKALPIARRLIILDSCFSGEIIRKFGSVERYKLLVPKGARAKRWIDLSQALPEQSEERSLQVLSSGLALSWESKRYKASIFTHHLLRGLQGRADRDLDGKISVYELFDFISDAMMRDIQEKPKMFGIVHRSHSYALAPAYSSHLVIGPQVVGRLQVSISNFFWSWHKQRPRPLRLAIIHGKGSVELKRGNQCWTQPIRLAKGSELQLSPQWQPIQCKKFANRRKGTVQLEAQEIISPPSPWRLEVHAGMLGSALSHSGLFWGAEIGLRHRYFGIYLGAWNAANVLHQTTYFDLLLGLHGEVGYRHRWNWFSLFAGGYAGFGWLIQDLGAASATDPSAGPLLHYGLALTPTFWLNSKWSLSLRARAGFTLSQQGTKWLHAFAWSTALGFAYAF